MTAQEMVIAMQAFFLTSGGWCKGACARDENGKPCSPLSPNAVQWDLYGRMIYLAFTENTDFTALHAAHGIFQGALPGGTKSKDIELFNDGIADEAGLMTIINAIVNDF